MRTVILVMVAIVATLMMSGCHWGTGKVGRAFKPATPTTVVDSPKTDGAEQNPTATVTGKSTTSIDPSGDSNGATSTIKVTRLDHPSIAAGNTDGLFLGDFYSATDTKTGEEIVRAGMGSPTSGSIKIYPTGHCRYYPPSRACEDRIPVRLYNSKGEFLETALPITVTGTSNVVQPGRDPVKNRSISITTPAAGYVLNGRVCNVEGTAEGYADGTKITLYVRTQYGQVWPQGPLSEISGGSWSAVVYIGDDAGNGVGEYYDIWARDSDGKMSRIVRITRKS